MQVGLQSGKQGKRCGNTEPSRCRKEADALGGCGAIKVVGHPEAIAVAKGANVAGGEAFASYVLGPEGQATLARYQSAATPR